MAPDPTGRSPAGTVAAVPPATSPAAPYVDVPDGAPVTCARYGLNDFAGATRPAPGEHRDRLERGLVGPTLLIRRRPAR
ncbi:hypothetical protein KCH_64340 [Kitasatospora cheerisanensis KCTC 2395]|uniref:Uncharacterized protein n=1 Tax=Kitasatospora cheerisanensis KCTC 2395 TaxID=1348663 RepID=A0A066YP32_9ACTN|nr:hypothetical protein KCH_64340 [Kitasatospora cheerisanensis KCTC 2395]